MRVSLLFPHQLFEDNPVVKKSQVVYLVEEQLFFREFSFHKQKLAFHRASMKAYAAWLQKNGNSFHYVDTMAPWSDIRKLIPRLKNEGVTHLDVIDPVDDWLAQRLTKTAGKAGMSITWYESPLFLNTPGELRAYFAPGKKKFFQTEFYIAERKSKRLLLDEDGGPSGGQWSFDAANRKPYPAGKIPPELPFLKRDVFYQEAIDYVLSHFPNAPGELESAPLYPFTFSASKAWLADFLMNRFESFGVYEDAIVARERVLHHGVLTPMLNIGLLTPQQIINASLQFATENKTPLNSVEGFLRQIVGWREFIRGIYLSRGGEQRNKNHWKFTRTIPRSFYTGTTGIEPVDITIRKVLKTGYCHHIERLMVLGNFMFLCGFHPQEVYRWFMELFVDAYDWVMVPNVYGMSQFADGGMMATKPYISGSRYILKMSDYRKGDWCEVWDALYWMFIGEHKDLLVRNPRMTMMVRQFEKMEDVKKRNFRQVREGFLRNLYEAPSNPILIP